MGLGEEGGRRKRTSDVSTTFTANTTVKCSCYSFHAAGLAPGQEFLFLTKIVTTGWADSVGRSILAALWASQHRRHGPPGPPPPCAAKPACPELRQATSQALAHQGSGSHSQADLQCSSLTHLHPCWECAALTARCYCGSAWWRQAQPAARRHARAAAAGPSPHHLTTFSIPNECWT